MPRTNLLNWAVRRLVIWLLALGGGYLLVFGGSSTSKPIRKKISIEVATPSGTARGASVIEMVHSHAPWWYPAAVKGATSERGEAPYADLGGRRYVFVTINNQLDERPISGSLLPESIQADGSFQPNRTPMIVTFGDIEDPNTIRKLEPGAFERAFGSGYRLVSLTATDTQDPPTNGTLARTFPVLHRQLSMPAQQRVPQPYQRGDLRAINWRAFETPPTP
ncbi:hypothetical protein [Bradyrhizobium sp. 27S5]|uniref:hypothetical protein n=1 Tax=Bradyrhizobium sp. 27S5 TaxID=3139728 RepID=UPI0030D5A19D